MGLHPKLFQRPSLYVYLLIHLLQVESLKQQGNECVKKKDYAAAILHYSHAIKNDDKIATLYSNRSLAFLKMEQYYYAMEDAKATIRLDPNWPKGHFRKGEVEFAVGNYTLAIMSYKYLVLQLLLVGVFTGLGLLIWMAYKYIQDNQKSSLLDPPIDLWKAMNGEEETDGSNNEEEKQAEKRHHKKGGASSARQRYKMGKS
ncbi:hypothetical protein FSP39_017755 [Pinctada imbricata]|uniref:Uncharacterized protein n=1 Tax=Pinctada imbricata TaxID=66713 RepID=A0AA88YJV9_PINIB|nr:hypothetical protein FSP39_017755 [Pinctada imbricata]